MNLYIPDHIPWRFFNEIYSTSWPVLLARWSVQKKTRSLFYLMEQTYGEILGESERKELSVICRV